MADNIISFARQREIHELKRKEEKVEALRRAFRLARGDGPGNPSDSSRKRRSKRQKKK